MRVLALGAALLVFCCACVATQRLAGYVVGGAGIVGLGVGALLYLDAQSTIDDANCPNHVCVEGVGDKDLHDQGRSKERRSIVVMGLGGALVATGVTLLLLAPSASSPTTASLYVAPLHDGAAMSLSGRF